MWQEAVSNREVSGLLMLSKLTTDRVFCCIGTEQLQLATKNILAQVSKNYRAIFQPEIDKIGATALLQYGLDGDEKSAKKIFKSNPKLALISVREAAIDHRGVEFKNITPIQVALLQGDLQMAKKMAKKILEDDKNIFHLKHLEEQFFQVFPFPNDIDEKFLIVAKALAATRYFERQKKTAFDFQVIFDVIKSADLKDVTAALNYPGKNNGSKLHIFLDEFRKNFKDKVFNEPHANCCHLLKAFELYLSKEIWNNNDWSDEKKDLFWNQVIGYVQRFLSAHDKRCFYNVFDLRNNSGQLKNRLKSSKSASKSSMFKMDENSGCGFMWAYSMALNVQVNSANLNSVQFDFREWSNYILQRNLSYGSYASIGEINRKVDCDKSLYSFSPAVPLLKTRLMRTQPYYLTLNERWASNFRPYHGGFASCVDQFSFTDLPDLSVDCPEACKKNEKPPKLHKLHMLESSRFFSKFKKNHLIEHRHSDPQLQHEYDKRYGIVRYKI